MEEIWKDIEGYEGIYQVSNLGRARRINKYNYKILKQFMNTSGYLMISLCKNAIKKTQRVNRLIAQTFILNPNNKTQVNHINGIKIDNRVENLEWCTPSENQLHSFKNGLNKSTRKRKVKCVETGEIFESATDVSLKYGLHVALISKVCHGSRKRTGGYMWQYI